MRSVLKLYNEDTSRFVEEETPTRNTYMSARESISWSWILRRLKPGMTVLAIQPTYRQKVDSRELSFDSWSNPLFVRQSLVGKDARMEAEDVVGIRYQATTCADTAN
jgi:hypothetical protein